MLIPCPHCGPRAAEEFEYGGDASAPPTIPTEATPEQAHAALHLRANPRGPHRELWYHAAGCRQWFTARRDTLTHRFLAEAP
ncbi:sarcosine oxidase subunit delta [Rhodovarius crocodyli]|uniref:Sarcosine oxidase subunit delta n=1 Tax=Rhodovarius crocodyli TaxID=1979269 RepID=A0A437MLR1_9PROT|nr:sarcosine oxidase subunit delta [Rhodovarius crocodyli]RVT98600.1 sarcosine oxidase subunit delta [Rhodovarius crocodyli]